MVGHQSVGAGRPVNVLGQAFVPMYTYGPDLGRKYAFIELEDTYYPLVFRNPALGEGADCCLDGHPVNFLERRIFATEAVSGGEVDERGFLCFRDRTSGWAWFTDYYTGRFPGYLVQDEQVAGLLLDNELN